jgi:hypothetical protein
MNVLSPLFLLGLFALAGPVVLHMLRRRVVRTVPFPALRFLAANRADQRKNNLRRRVVLALRCLALALLALAFARPFLGTPPAPTTRATVIVIDNSFSLQTDTRWQDLLSWTRAEVGSPVNGNTLGLLLMNPRPTWLVAPTHEMAAPLAALETLTAGWESTRAEPALRLAADVLSATPASERRILFLGDHQAIGWTGVNFSKPLPPGVTVVFPPSLSVTPKRQAALTGLTLVREGDSMVVSLTVRNFTAAHSRTVSVFAENTPAPIITQSLNLPANESVTLKLPVNTAIRSVFAWIRVTLDADALPADDTAWAIAPATQGERRIFIDRPPASSGNANTSADYVTTAYTALANVPPFLRPAATPGIVWPTPAVAILRNDASFTGEARARLDAFLAASGTALIFLDGGPAQLAWLSARRAAPIALAWNPARIRDWTLDHPLLAPLAEHNLRSLVGWEFNQGWSLPAEAFEPLALWDDGSIGLGELRTGTGRVLVAGFSPDRREGEWPVQPAFVPFLHRCASYLLGLAASAADSPLRVGTPIELPSTTIGTWRALAGPAADSPPIPLSGNVTPTAPGVYEFTAANSPRRLYAVGLAPEESDPALWREGTPWLSLISPEKNKVPSPETHVTASQIDTEKQSPLWWWAFAAMALFTLAELGLANRTAR